MRVFTNDYLIRLRLLPLLAIAAAITFPVPASGQASFQGLGDLPDGGFFQCSLTAFQRTATPWLGAAVPAKASRRSAGIHRRIRQCRDSAICLTVTF